MAEVHGRDKVSTLSLMRWLSYKRVYHFRPSPRVAGLPANLKDQGTALFSFEGTNSREFAFADAGNIRD